MGYILALIGLGLMVGFAGGGSAIGTSITGSSVLGMLRKRPDQFGPGMVLTAVPGTQGLYGFVGFFLYKAMLSPDLTILQGAIFLGAGLMMGTACFISGIFQGKVCANGINAIGNGQDVFGKTMVLAAFPEFYAILSLIGAILLLSVMK
ncbi:MAG: ATPase [Elusimicrobia bacterium RIFOXYB2_FULL_49_7]|nr:MAG: ATPase [Elusimicrobia bacterium RIFOXYB2_FULL_49_7]